MIRAKNQKTKIKKLNLSYITVMLSLIIFLLTPSPANANMLDDNPFRIKQTLKVKGGYAIPQDVFTYKLESVSNKEPLPDGSSDVYEFTLRGNEEKIIDSKFFKEKNLQKGEYEYRIYQKIENIKDIEQDKKIYTVVLKVDKLKDGTDKYTYTIKDSEGFKRENIEFINKINKNININLPNTGIKTDTYKDFILLLVSILTCIYFVKSKEKKY